MYNQIIWNTIDEIDISDYLLLKYIECNNFYHYYDIEDNKTVINGYGYDYFWINHIKPNLTYKWKSDIVNKSRYIYATCYNQNQIKINKNICNNNHNIYYYIDQSYDIDITIEYIYKINKFIKINDDETCLYVPKNSNIIIKLQYIYNNCIDYNNKYINHSQLNIKVIDFPYNNLCFCDQTIIKLDKGLTNITNIKVGDKIRNMPIQQITKAKLNTKYIICIKKNALGFNRPNVDTYLSENHAIYIYDMIVSVKYLVNLVPGIDYIVYNNDIYYNILLTTHTYMYANNILIETLNPNNS